MKKALALVLAVVMMAGFAITASAANLAGNDTDAAALFTAVIDSITADGEAIDPAATTLKDAVVDANSVVNINLKAAAEFTPDGGTAISAEDMMVKSVAIKDGKNYASDLKLTKETTADPAVISFVAKNTTSDPKAVVLRVTTKGGDYFDITVTVNGKADNATFGLKDVDAAGIVWDLSLTAGKDTANDEYGYFSAGIFNAMKAKSADDAKILITAADGSYEMEFNKNSGSVSGSKIDIYGSTDVSDAMKEANADLNKNLMAAINLNSNTAKAKFTLYPTQDFLDAAGDTLYVYTAKGEKTSYKATLNDDKHIEFTAPVGSYIVSPVELKASGSSTGEGTGTGSKPIPGTGR